MGWHNSCTHPRIIRVKHAKMNLYLHLLPGMNLKFLPQIRYPIIYNPRRYLSELDFDLLHLNSHLNFQSQLLASKAKKMGKPIVLTIHGVIGYYNPLINFAQKAYLRILNQTLFKWVDRIICLTSADSAELSSIGVSTSKMHVIPNGVNEDFFIPGPKTESKEVIWHGRFIPQKGLPDLVKSAYIVNKKLPDVSYYLMGWGPQMNYIKQLVHRAGLSSIFTFAGKQPWDDVPKNLARAQVYALPSYREGMPFSLLEAMSCGTPAVAYSIPSTADIIEHGVDGYLVKLGDYHTFSKYILKLLRDENLRNEMSINARKKIEEHFRWSAIARKYDVIYQSLLQ